MPRTFCKYCKKRTHMIDDCPTIICHTCGQRGHPTWLCKKQVRRMPQVVVSNNNEESVWNYLNQCDRKWAEM